MLHIQAYTITELAPYINWIYFFHAWGMPPRFATVTQVHDCPGCRGAWQAQFPESDQAQAREGIKLYAEAQQMLRTLSSKNCRINSIVGLFPAWSDGDDVMVAANPDGTTPRRLCFLRQQQVLQKTPHTSAWPILSVHTAHPPTLTSTFCPSATSSDFLPLPPKSPWNTFMTMTTSNACWCKRSPTVWPKRRLSGSMSK